MRYAWLVGCVVLVLPACAGIKVTDHQRNALPGIPFYIKSPRLVQETRLAGDQLGIQFEVKIKNGGETTVHHMPAAGPQVLPPSPAAEQALQDAEEQFAGLSESLTADAAIVRIGEIIAQLRQVDRTPSPALLVSNTRKYEMIAGPEVYYVKSRIPFMGSASTQFEFAPDGTLTKLQAETKEETFSTVLSMVPVTAWLTKQWGLSSPVADAVAPASIEARQLLDRLQFLHPTPTQPVTTTVSLMVTRTPLVYTLRRLDTVHKVDTVETGTRPQRILTVVHLPESLEPLTIDDALEGRNKVELVSVQPAGAAPGKDEHKGYQFSGEVIPPKSN